MLTSLLLDTLLSSAPARIVNVSSVAHEKAKIDFDDLQSETSFRPMRTYGRSKPVNLLFTYELARRLEGTHVTANALNPGLVRTNIGTSSGGRTALGERVAHLVWRRHVVSADEGARTITLLAASPSVEGVSGKYFTDERAVPSSDASHDAEAARRLWEASSTLTGLSPPTSPPPSS